MDHAIDCHVRCLDSSCHCENRCCCEGRERDENGYAGTTFFYD